MAPTPPPYCVYLPECCPVFEDCISGTCTDTTSVDATCDINTFIISTTGPCRDPRPTDASGCDTTTNKLIESDTSCVVPTTINIGDGSCAANTVITSTDATSCVTPSTSSIGDGTCVVNTLITSTDATSCRDPLTTDAGAGCTTNTLITDTSGTCKTPVTTDVNANCDANAFIGASTDGTTCKDAETTDIDSTCTADTFITATSGTNICRAALTTDANSDCDTNTFIGNTDGSACQQIQATLTCDECASLPLAGPCSQGATTSKTFTGDGTADFSTDECATLCGGLGILSNYHCSFEIALV